jgi:glycine dehydrogenase
MMPRSFERFDQYKDRHIGPDALQLKEMLKEISVDSLNNLMGETIPENIFLDEPLDLPLALGEYEFLQLLRRIAQENMLYKTYIGMGFYNSITPSVIQRMIFENPGWYTQYTPYQAEISQGRLEALINFQTAIIDLTGMAIANASLLDEGTAAAEAMTMMFRLKSKDLIKSNTKKFFVSDRVLCTTIDILKTRSKPLGIDLMVGDFNSFSFDTPIFGALLQYPAEDGELIDYTDFIEKAHTHSSLIGVVADILSLVLLKSPGEMGADIVVGSTQRFGIPLGYGGPHAAYFATREEYMRQIPGRIIGVSVDRYGNKAYRMALQTREQHIRREKATSNICTAQALLAIMAGMYAVYHGPTGLKEIALRIHRLTNLLNNKVSVLGLNQINHTFFDTLKLHVTPEQKKKIQTEALKLKINFRYFDSDFIGISLDETTSLEDVQQILGVLASAVKGKAPTKQDNILSNPKSETIPPSLLRKDNILTHPVFHNLHSETKMQRYIKQLENKDLSLTTSMIPLGSCTMKLNPATAMLPISWPEFSGIHPFVPQNQVKGYRQIIQDLEGYLCEITGLHACSLQPNSGAQGEFTGLMVIMAYFRSRGENQRDVTLIPSSAHGTNPASAVMAGSKVVIVNCSGNGDVDLEDLRHKAFDNRDRLAALMITYPSTHGVFEKEIVEICDIIHKNGGQVYMDGANMNAQVGLTKPGIIGADVCHLNLHKTFSIPHGGGGPGVGPICVAEHLAAFLPGHSVIKTGGTKGISAVASTPWGSSSILIISYAYIRMLGALGLTEATRYAILNANYVKSRLERYFPVLYKGEQGRIGHELIFDTRDFKETTGIEAEDIAKRLMDFGFHAPTMSFPVPGTLMFEPTESESKEELDRFCEAMITIYDEIMEISQGKADFQDNVLKNAPHTIEEIASEHWDHPYSRNKAAYPAPFVRKAKFWPAVGRIDNTYGDRNLFCSCPPVELYQNHK